MAASPPSLSDPNPNRTVVAVHRHLVNDFEPATKQLSNASISLYRALHGASQAAKEYTRALQSVAMASQLGQPMSREFGHEISEISVVFDRINEQHEETIAIFRAMATKVVDYNKKDVKDLKDMAQKYSKDEKALIKQVQKGTANGDTLARFYQEHQIDALEQERKRYQFIAEKHREWLASYGKMFQTLAPIINKEASQSKAIETPQQASNNQAAPPTTFTPPDIDSSISLSRSTSESSTEAPPYSSDAQGANGNIIFMSMNRRDSTPVKAIVEVSPPVHTQHNGNNEDIDDAHYVQVVKPTKTTPPPTPTEQLVQANIVPVQSDIVMKPASPPSPAPTPVPPSPPARTGNEKLVYVIHNFAATSDNQLSIYAGDRIRLQKFGTQGWAFGVNLTTNKSGWFPQGFVQEAFTVR